MASPDNNQTDNPATGTPSLLSKYQQAIEGISTSPEDALSTLLDLRTQVAALDLFSLNDDSLVDIPTSYLPFLSIPHHIATAYIASNARSSLDRYENVKQATELFHDFLRRMERLMSSSEGEEGRLYRGNNLRREYHDLLDKLDEHPWEDSNEEMQRRRTARVMSGEPREEKIARFKRRRQMEDSIAALEAKRRNRQTCHKGNEAHDEDDDDESLLRELYIKQLILQCMTSMEELSTCHKEMEMLQMAVKMEQQRQEMERLHGGPTNSDAVRIQQGNHFHARDPTQQQAPKKPIELTHITQHPATGKLIFQKEQIQSTVFRPSWNLPTMTLAELGERERAAAVQRSQQQDEAAPFQPKRYDQLVAEGLEDDHDLVEDSADLDRKWDDFKDENPRGSGNKMGDRGDRNF